MERENTATSAEDDAPESLEALDAGWDDGDELDDEGAEGEGPLSVSDAELDELESGWEIEEVPESLAGFEADEEIDAGWEVFFEYDPTTGKTIKKRRRRANKQRRAERRREKAGRAAARAAEARAAEVRKREEAAKRRAARRRQKGPQKPADVVPLSVERESDPQEEIAAEAPDAKPDRKRARPKRTKEVATAPKRTKLKKRSKEQPQAVESKKLPTGWLIVVALVIAAVIVYVLSR